MSFVRPEGEDRFELYTRILRIQEDIDVAVSPAESLLDRAYADCRMQKRLLVLINPHGGQGKAGYIYSRYCEPFLQAAHCVPTVVETTHHQHATEIARDLDLSLYDAIVCCSGDGIPHEVINGFAQRENDSGKALREMPICQMPCGSGNSVAVSLNGSPSPTLAALDIIKGAPMAVDLMRFSQASNPHVLTFLSQTYGIVADCDLGTEGMRWMGGQRFVVGAIMRSLAKASYPCDIYVKYAHEDKQQVKKHFHEQQLATVPSADSKDVLPPPRFGSINDPVPSDWIKLEKPDLAMFYVGKLPWMSADALVFPASLPTDGTLDFITYDATGGRLKSLDVLIKIEKGQHFHMDEIQYSKVEGYRLVPNITDGYLSIDGESYPLEPFQVEVLPATGCLLSASGSYTRTNLHHSN